MYSNNTFVLKMTRETLITTKRCVFFILTVHIGTVPIIIIIDKRQHKYYSSLLDNHIVNSIYYFTELREYRNILKSTVADDEFAVDIITRK